MPSHRITRRLTVAGALAALTVSVLPATATAAPAAPGNPLDGAPPCTKTFRPDQGRWENPSNWSPDGVPSGTDVVCVMNATVVIARAAIFTSTLVAAHAVVSLHRDFAANAAFLDAVSISSADPSRWSVFANIGQKHSHSQIADLSGDALFLHGTIDVFPGRAADACNRPDGPQTGICVFVRGANTEDILLHGRAELYVRPGAEFRQLGTVTHV